MKKNASRAAIIRKIVGSVLSSDMTNKDIDYFSDDLIHDREFSFELGHALRMSLYALEAKTDYDPDMYYSRSRSWLTDIVDIIQEKHISKKEVIMAIPPNLINDISFSSLIRQPLIDILERTLEKAPKKLIDEFISNLGIRIEQDPYLAGIEKKR